MRELDRRRAGRAPGAPYRPDAKGGGPTSLAGSLLVAMPGMGDPRFERAVVFLCAHSDDGAMGLMVNKPSADVGFADLARQLEIPRGEASREIAVHVGGPVELGRGFVLHSADWDSGESTLHIGGRFGMTATIDVLQALVAGDGPRDALLALGYAGWGAGQLELEIAGNGWLTVPASREIVFALPDARKWGGALAALGVDPVSLSAVGGRA